MAYLRNGSKWGAINVVFTYRNHEISTRFFNSKMAKIILILLLNQGDANIQTHSTVQQQDADLSLREHWDLQEESESLHRKELSLSSLPSKAAAFPVESYLQTAAALSHTHISVYWPTPGKHWQHNSCTRGHVWDCVFVSVCFRTQHTITQYTFTLYFRLTTEIVGWISLHRSASMC